MKKIGLLLMLFLVVGAFSASFVHADEPWDSIKSVVTLGFMTNLGFQSSLDPFEGLVRFLLLILLFTLFVYLAMMILPKNVSVVVALVLSLISVIFIPGPVLVAAATSYSTIVALAFLAVPLLALFGGYYLLRERPWLRAFLAGVLLWILYRMEVHLTDLATGAGLSSSHYSSVIATVQQPLGWLINVAWAVFIWDVFRALLSWGGATEHNPGVLRNLVDKYITQNVPGTARYNEKRRESREETRPLNLLVEEEKVRKDLTEVVAQTDVYKKMVDRIKTYDYTVDSKHYVEELEQHFEMVKKTVKTLEDEENKLKRSLRKEQDQISRLMETMEERGTGPDATGGRSDLKKRQAAVLNDFTLVEREFREVEKHLGFVERNHKVLVEGCKKVYEYVDEGLPLNQGNTGMPGHTGGLLLYPPSGGKIYPPSGGKNVLTGARQAVDELVARCPGLLVHLREAAKQENIAVKDTSMLVEQIRKDWKAPPLEN